MKNSEKIKEYFSRVIEIINQMRKYGKDISDQKVVEKILISLTDKYDYIITAIEKSKYLSTLSIQQLMSSFESHEERKLQREVNLVEDAFHSKLSFRRRYNPTSQGNIQEKKAQKEKSPGTSHSRFWCDIHKWSNHSTSQCWSKKTCNKCKMLGHVARVCRSRVSDRANFIEEKESHESIFYACHSAKEEKGDIWFLDSGCMNYMTGNHELFQEINTSYQTKVRMRNGTLVQAKGKGSIAIQTKMGSKFI
ncbi:uncharacterized protein LOC144561415 [Carex rostrata]